MGEPLTAVSGTQTQTGLGGGSTSGYMFLISGAVVNWKSRKQSSVVLCTAEAEYMALASAAQEAVWIQQLIGELRNETARPVTINEDNQAAI